MRMDSHTITPNNPLEEHLLLILVTLGLVVLEVLVFPPNIVMLLINVSRDIPLTILDVMLKIQQVEQGSLY
jgi:hypothetical protein